MLSWGRVKNFPGTVIVTAYHVARAMLEAIVSKCAFSRQQAAALVSDWRFQSRAERRFSGFSAAKFAVTMVC